MSCQKASLFLSHKKTIGFSLCPGVDGVVVAGPDIGLWRCTWRSRTEVEGGVPGTGTPFSNDGDV